MEAPATLSAWQPGGAGALGLAGAAPVSPRRPASGAGGHEAASPAESASSSQHGLFGGFPGGGGGAEAAAQHGPAPDGASPAQQLRNLQRLYGLAGVHHHSSRTSLPDIAEEEPSPQQGGGGGGGAGLPAAGSGQGLAASGKPASKVMSEEDIFAMSGGLEIPGGSGGGEPAAAGGGGGGGMGVAGAPPLAYDLSLVGQMPAGASQSRTLFVRNIDASITDEELQAVFEAFGEIASIYTACKHRGFVVISYFDLRAASLASHTLQGQALKGQPLEVHFSLPKDDKEARQATVLAVSMDPSLGHQELLYLFSQFGDVKGVEQDAGRPNCRFVEFYDLRHAAAAVQGVSSAPDMAGRLVVMEAAAALPGGGPLGAAAAGGGAGVGGSASQGALLGSSLPSDFMAGLQPPGGMKSVGSSPALLQQLHYGSSSSFAPPPAQQASQSMSQIDIATYLLSSQGAGSMGSLQQAQQAAAAAAAAAAAQGQQQQQAAAAAAMLGPSSMGDLSGMARSFSELSLQSDLNRVALVAGGPGGPLAGPGGGRLPGGALSTGDLLSLQQQQAAAAGGMGGRGMGAMGLRGIASTGSIWSSATQQQMFGGGGGGAAGPGSLGSSPVNSAPWLGTLGTLGGSSSALQEALAQQQAALQQQAVNAALLQNAAAVQAAAAAGQSPLAQNAAMQAALQQALLNQQAAVLLQSGALGLPGGGAYLGQRMPQRMEAPLGGRLARRPLDPAAEAERRAQQEKLYSLDIARIRSGEDKRTTLMIKNIPNKYTQKMLLALIEERFRGMFDFFYLPIDFKNKCNVGYAFINMVKPEYIVPVFEEFHGKRWPKFNSEKICNIAYGRIQGKAALVQHFQNSSLLHEDKRCRPVLFHTDGMLAGEQEPFPTSATPPL